MSAAEPPPPAGKREEVWCKNRLQEFTQRASMPLPVYQTFSEGPQHLPLFRSQVWVDGTCFTSPNSFSNRRMAEQDAAKYALIGIQEKVKNEGSSLILQDTMFCKSIMHEYALKMNLKIPTYVTNESKAPFPVFISSLVLNDVTYVGNAGKNKKEAEQFAARSAILSILDSESSTTMLEIVKSKFKFYDALKKVKDSSSSVQVSSTVPAASNPLDDVKDSVGGQDGNVPAGINPLEDIKDSTGGHVGHVPAGTNPLADGGATFSVNKRKEDQLNVGTIVGPSEAVPNSCLSAPFLAIQGAIGVPTLEQGSYTQPTQESLHIYKKPKLQASQEAIAIALPIEFVPPIAIAPPIEFVPPASEQAPTLSTSAKKRNRKNKKAKKSAQLQSALTIVAIPQNPFPACSVPQ